MSRELTDTAARPTSTRLCWPAGRPEGDPEGAALLTPHERLRELTAILANGIHRLRTITPAVPECPEIPAESSQTGLEAVATTRPYGTGRQPERTPEA